MALLPRLRFGTFLKLALAVLLLVSSSLVGLVIFTRAASHHSHSSSSTAHSSSSHSHDLLGYYHVRRENGEDRLFYSLKQTSQSQSDNVHFRDKIKSESESVVVVAWQQKPITPSTSVVLSSPPPHKTPKGQLHYMSQQFPKVMIIGFGKAGTRALFDVLKMHPALTGPYVEKRFFSDHYENGLRSYLNSLPKPRSGEYVVEKSPNYITHPQAPERILSSAKILGIRADRLKFVVVLRDPIDRAVSQYLEWQVSRRRNKKQKLLPFSVMALNQNKTVNIDQPFLKHSNYARFIKQWFLYFNRSQTCFVDGDMFAEDPYSEVHLLESCLSLHPFFTPEHFVFNSNKGFYCFKASVNQTVPHCMGAGKGRKHPNIPEKVLNVLQEHYQKFDAELQALTGRTMLWQKPQQ